jgi:glutamate 5-kinase
MKFHPSLIAAQSVTLKVGSSLVIDKATGEANLAWMRGLAQDMAALKGQGKAVMLVTSGAVGLGRRYLGLTRKSLLLEEKQAAAAAGQPLLMRAWETVFAEVGIKSAQILLTREDTERRQRWLNARETLSTLIGLGAIPIVNENDTVATDEIRYGDNDRLAARAAMLIKAQLLILLSDVDGLYTADPRKDPAALHLAFIDRLTPEIEAMGGGANSQVGLGSGGMSTKLMAAKIAGSAGCDTLIAHGGIFRPLGHMGKSTLIKAQSTANAAYKAWIAGTVEPAGHLHIDAGAAKALKNGKSLLPSGIISVSGRFEAGESLSIAYENHELARGIAAYGSQDIDRIKGHGSQDIEALLGYSSGDEVVHRDDLVMM